MKRIKLVTYNIHRCRGMDRRVRPDRIVEVLREVDADVVALQEVWSRE
ncbi:MAG TPA: endonuclease/exonuclease/phosphatase family protein, partial [Blastocatellia bacterium]|nr:endonuclease/exonuclease/phosphatase family protein [Blastocatellia bacterium]